MILTLIDSSLPTQISKEPEKCYSRQETILSREKKRALSDSNRYSIVFEKLVATQKMDTKEDQRLKRVFRKAYQTIIEQRIENFNPKTNDQKCLSDLRELYVYLTKIKRMTDFYRYYQALDLAVSSQFDYLTSQQTLFFFKKHQDQGKKLDVSMLKEQARERVMMPPVLSY